MPSNIYNIYRRNSPFTSRTVYYDTTAIPDFLTVRNRFVTNNLPPACDSILFSGEDTNLLNSLDPTETPTIFQFSSDDSACSGFVNIVQNAELEINFFINPIITQIELYGEVFVSAPVVTNTNEFLDNTFPNVIDRAQSLVTAINNNTNLNWRYTAYLDASIPVIVRIRANYPGSQYNFVAPYYNIVTPTPAISAVVATSFDKSRGMLLQNFGYKMFLEIWSLDVEWLRGGDIKIFGSNPRPTLVATLEQTWNEENIFTFDVSKYFRINKSISNFLSGVQIFESYTSQGKEGIKGYFLKWGEMFTGGYDSVTDLPVDDPWDIQNIIYTKNYLDITEIRWASNGMYNLGILILFNSHPEQWLSIDANGLGATENVYQTVKWSQDWIWGKLEPGAGVKTRYKLRRRVDTGTVGALQDHEYLTLLVANDRQFTSTVDLRLFTEWTFVDGTTATSTSHFTTLVSRNDFYEIDVNFANVDLANVELAAGKRVLLFSHTAQIRRDGINWTDLSEPAWYQMDLNLECEKYYKLWWTGSQGTTESFEFEGVTQMDLNYSAEYYTKSFKNNLYERNNHIVQAVSKIPNRRFRLNTGWLTLDQYDWLESLLKTNFVWWKSTYRLDLYFGGNLLPINYPAFEAINIVDSSMRIDNDNKLFNLEIVLEYSVLENQQY